MIFHKKVAEDCNFGSQGFDDGWRLMWFAACTKSIVRSMIEQSFPFAPGFKSCRISIAGAVP